VPDEFSAKFRNEPRGDAGQYKQELIEALTAMWNAATSGPTAVPIFNKKLHVRHVAVSSASGTESIAAYTAPPASSAQRSLPSTVQEGAGSKRNNTNQMSADQMYEEITSLRRKYDELVAFSVNLTAERDILNNTLEQTKRDLNREMAARAALEMQGLKVSRSQDMKSKHAGGGFSFKTLLIAVVISFLFAVKATNKGSVGVLKKVPVLRSMLSFQCCPKHKKKDGGEVKVETSEL
jgi:hypothetical protein